MRVTGSSELPAFFVPWSWRLQVCSRVSNYQPCYMGHILGMAVLWSSWQNMCCTYSSQKGSR